MIFNKRILWVFPVLRAQNGKVLVVRRGQYIGLPGASTLENESIDDCGLRIIRSLAVTKNMTYRHIHLARFDGFWDNREASIYLAGFPFYEKIYPVAGTGAFWIDINEPLLFDITIEELKKAQVSIPIHSPEYAA